MVLAYQLSYIGFTCYQLHKPLAYSSFRYASRIIVYTDAYEINKVSHDIFNLRHVIKVAVHF